jgi:hypothetical protein
MKIIEAISINIISVVELRDAYPNDETIKFTCYGLYYLITETCKEFGVTRQDVVKYIVECMDYPYAEALLTVDRYELFAQKVIVRDSKRNQEHC